MLVQDKKLRKPIVLIGHMGAGKSCVGHALAHLLNVRFFDIDKVIEDSTAMTIPEIFARQGEAHFREIERHVIEDILAEKPAVIATGGGAFMDPKTRHLIAQKAFSIWLTCPCDILAERIKDCKHRPLIQNSKDIAHTLKQLAAQRDPFFEKADMHIASKHADETTIAHRIISRCMPRLT